MAITNPQAVAFCNDILRLHADAMVSAYESAKKAAELYTAGDMATLIPNNVELVEDGSAVDGRPRVTGAHVTRLFNQANQVVTWFESIAPGDSVTRITRYRQVAVRGKSPF